MFKGSITEPLPRLRIVVLDFECAAFIDVIDLQVLSDTDTKIDLQVFAGEHFELRCMGVSEDVRLAFERSGWELMDAMGECSFDFVAVGDET